jgi:hypothetical protein
MKNVRFSRVALTVMAIALLMANTAQAVNVGFTGDPGTDNWLEQGLSTEVGTYIRGDGNWSYKVYTASFTLTAGSPLLGANWQVGDLILGMGGVMNPNTQDFSPRLVAKFGAADATFKPSTTLTSGDGIGSFSGGAAGAGGIQMDFFYARNWPSGVLPSGLNGVIQTPEHVIWQYNQQINTDYGKVLALFETNTFMTNGYYRDIFQSFEVLLNVTAVSDAVRGDKGALVPVLHGKGDMAVQQSSSGSTDAYVPHVGANVPLPPSVLLLGSGLLGLVGLRWRRARKES